ncbi:MAG: Cys-tRNA(Pro)/Cys-tRNA(Cys) deacylase [Ilumatobacter sp.]|jgi:Cys-tRNA(Pro)/Cys-tRNA(Cys) deacylase
MIGVTGRLREDGRVTPAVKMLESAGVEHVISEYDRHLSGDGDLRDFGKEAAEALGLSDDEVFKTLIVVVEGSPRSPEMIVAVLPVSCQLSMKLIAAAAGAKKATMCDPAAAERSSGYVVGGISPLGQRRQLRTVVDESAQLFDTIYVSGGKRGLDIGLAPDDLIGVLHATVAPITA